MIAIALAGGETQLLIADEPTTALDVTIQAQVLELFQELQRRIGMAVMLITHDLGVVAETAGRVAVMYAGSVVEYATVDDLFARPGHPYTQGLLRSLPQRGRDARKSRLFTVPGAVPDLLDLEPGCKFFARCLHAVADVCPGQRATPGGGPGAGRRRSPGALPPGRRDRGAGAVCVSEPATPRAAAGGRDADFLEVRDLRKYFPVRRGILLRTVGQVQAVDGVSFAVTRGTTLGLVGESGCGKTTTARLIVHLEQPDAGQVLIDGRDTADISGAALRRLRTVVQMIFQDPYSSLNPHHTARRILGEPLLVHGLCTRAEVGERVAAILERVNLSADFADRYPHELSGGQRQRIGIARAVAVEPRLIVCDEPVSALDVSIRSQILNLLLDLQEELDLTYLFVAHDLSVIEHVSDVIAVMYSRQDRRIRAYRPVPCAYAAPLQRGVAVGGTRTRSAGAQAADRVVGRRAEPAEPAQRVPVPHPLSAGRRTLRRRGTTVTRSRAAAPAGVPSPRMTAAQCCPMPAVVRLVRLLRLPYHLYYLYPD